MARAKQRPVKAAVLARENVRLTLADYVALALNPTLIVGMVCGLLFFLLEILYAGDYSDRMRFTLVAFLVGIVCVTRISVRPDIARRSLFYTLLLGGTVYFALLRWMNQSGESAHNFGPLIILGLMGVVWWSAHCLTRDCIHLDADAEIGNEGLLDAALTHHEVPSRGAEVEAADEAASPQGGSWLERYRRYRAKRSKRRTPGVWVVYFSLAALPLFGVGQVLIPAEEEESRRFAFFMLCAYVGCGLGLLLTTALIGLRRYLRQRGAKMPSSMTGSWLTTGTILIILFLLLAALLPRPLAEYSLNPFKLRSREREASEHALLPNSAGKDKGALKGDPGKTKLGESYRKSRERGEADKKGVNPGDVKGKEGKAKEEESKDANSKVGSGKGIGSQDDSTKPNLEKDELKKHETAKKNEQSNEATLKEAAEKNAKEKSGKQKEGETKGALAKDAQGKDAEGKDGQGKEPQGKEGQNKDAMAKNAKDKDGRGKEPQGKEGQNKDAMAKNAKDKDGQGKEPQGKDGQGKDAMAKDAPGKDGRGKDGQGKEPQGKEGQGKDAMAKDAPGKDGRGKDGEKKDPQGKDATGKDVMAKSDHNGPGKKEQNKDAVAKAEGAKNEQSQDAQAKGTTANGAPSKSQPGEEKKDGGKEPRKEEEKKASPGEPPPKPPPNDVTETIGSPLKWLIFLLVALILIGLLTWRLWRKRGLASAAQAGLAPALPPFAVFTDPFADGRAQELSPQELVAYSFNAMEAWAKERDMVRGHADTPLEFTARVADETPVIECEILRLGDLYTQASYAPGQLTPECVPNVQKFWQGLAKVEAEPEPEEVVPA